MRLGTRPDDLVGASKLASTPVRTCLAAQHCCAHAHSQLTFDGHRAQPTFVRPKVHLYRSRKGGVLISVGTKDTEPGIATDEKSKTMHYSIDAHFGLSLSEIARFTTLS